MVLEGTRRVIGWALPLTAIAFLVYAALFTQRQVPVLLEQLYLSTEGIFGSTLGRVGVLRDAVRAVRRLHGAQRHRAAVHGLRDGDHRPPGRRAGQGGGGLVELFGTVSGSAVANVMVDGPITIPLMKRTGFRPPFAAAVEAVASTGGQMMPPVMGAAAFVMAEFLAVPYARWRCGRRFRRCCTTWRCSLRCTSWPSARAWPACRARSCRAWAG